MSGRVTTITLAIVLVAVFLYEVAISAVGNEIALIPLGALRTRDWAATDLWRVFTFSFLHLNALHLMVNLAGLVWLGGILERRLGSASMLAIFSASAVSSGIAGMLLGPLLPTTGVAIGASGAVFGLLAASLILVFRRDASMRTEQDRRLLRALTTCLIVVSAISFLPTVSLAGHLGGFIGGALMVLSITYRQDG